MPRSSPAAVSELRAMVFKRAGGRCEAVTHHPGCSGVNQQLAHIYGKALGGSAIRNIPQNCAALNVFCHQVLDGVRPNPEGFDAAERREELWVKINVWPLLPDTGPCLLCETGLPAKHRVADAVWELLLAGEAPEVVADTYSAFIADLVALRGVWSAYVAVTGRRDG